MATGNAVNNICGCAQEQAICDSFVHIAERIVSKICVPEKYPAHLFKQVDTFYFHSSGGIGFVDALLEDRRIVHKIRPRKAWVYVRHAPVPIPYEIQSGWVRVTDGENADLFRSLAIQCIAYLEKNTGFGCGRKRTDEEYLTLSRYMQAWPWVEPFASMEKLLAAPPAELEGMFRIINGVAGRI